MRVCLLAAAVLLGAEAKKKSTKGGSKSCSHTGFYSKKIVPLCEAHFPDDASKHLWLVQFYHTGIQKVYDQRDEFEKFARNSGDAKVGAVDCAQNVEFCAKQGIREAPTTRAISRGRVRDFAGEHTFEHFEKFATESANRFKEMEEALKCNVKGLFGDALKDATVPLCTKSFPPPLEPVPWIVGFYETGDHNKDKTIRKTLNRVAEKYGNMPPKKIEASSKKPLKMRVGAVDCTKQEDCESLGVTTFPTIRFYRSGAEPTTFDSFVDKDELKQWADAQLKSMAEETPEPVELKADMSAEEQAAKQTEGAGEEPAQGGDDAGEEAKEAKSTKADAGCFTKGTEMDPLNLEGQGRSDEPDAAACQTRCAETAGCGGFSFWDKKPGEPAGGCHIAPEGAKPKPAGADVRTGPPACLEGKTEL